MNTRSLPNFLRNIRAHWRTVLARALCFLVLWVILTQSVKPADLVCGLISTVIATHMSLRLLPPAGGQVRLVSLLIFVPHFLVQSLLAGIDVARRALHPRLPLRPGFVVYRVGFPPGMARNQFAIITSLLPGSVPVDEVEDGLVYHCLDVTRPVIEQLSDEERRLSGILISGE
jgi:multicomponent Na+:H+ antiporter subunit E